MICTIGLGKVIEILHELWLQAAANRKQAERGKWNDVTIKLPSPVDQTVTTGVADHDVTPCPTVGNILIRISRVRNIVLIIAVVVIIHVDQVIATASIAMVPASATYQPVVTKITKDTVVTVGVEWIVVWQSHTW